MTLSLKGPSGLFSRTVEFGARGSQLRLKLYSNRLNTRPYNKLLRELKDY